MNESVEPLSKCDFAFPCVSVADTNRADRSHGRNDGASYARGRCADILNDEGMGSLGQTSH